MEMEVSRRKFLQGSVALSVAGGSAITATNLFGETEDILYVKGSGWDLATIEKEGFSPVDLKVLQDMAKPEWVSNYKGN